MSFTRRLVRIKVSRYLWEMLRANSKFVVAASAGILTSSFVLYLILSKFGPSGTETLTPSSEARPAESASSADTVLLVRPFWRYTPQDLEKSLAAYSAAIENAPDKAELSFRRGELNRFLGHMAEALFDVRRAAELDATKAAYLFELADLRHLSGDKRGALDELNKLETLGVSIKEHAMAYIFRAELLEEFGDSDGALRQYVAVFAADSVWQKTVGGDCAKILQKRGEHHQAANLYGIYGGEEYLRSLAHEYDEMEPGVAKIYLDRAISLNPNDDKSLILRGRIFTRLNDYPAAIEDFSRASKIKPSEEAFTELGYARYDLADYPGAIQALSKAIELTGGARMMAAELLFNRSLAKRQLGDRQGALDDLNETLRLDPSNAEALYNRGIMRLQLKNRPEGCRDLFDSLYKGHDKAHSVTNDLCRAEAR